MENRSSNQKAKYFVAAFAEGVDVKINEMPEGMKHFRTSALTHPMLIGATPVTGSTHRPMKHRMPKGLLEYTRKPFIESAKEPAQFKTRAPPTWPQGRIVGQNLSVKEADEIIRQEWKQSMSAAILQARINRHQIKEGPHLGRTRNGQTYATPSPFLKDSRLQ